VILDLTEDDVRQDLARAGRGAAHHCCGSLVAARLDTQNGEYAAARAHANFHACL